MKKKQIIMILLIAVLSIGIISLYTTFAYNEEAAILDESTADYNLIYQVKSLSNKYITLNAQEEKFIDIVITNTYKSNLKYGMYYKLLNPKNSKESINISLAEESKGQLQSIIKPNNTKTISLKIKNGEDSSIDLVVGALVGFEQGKIEDLQKEGEILIK